MLPLVDKLNNSIRGSGEGVIDPISELELDLLAKCVYINNEFDHG